MKNTAKLLGVAILIMVISTLFTGCTAGPMIAPQYSNAYPPPDPKPSDKVKHVLNADGTYTTLVRDALYKCEILAYPNTTNIMITVFQNNLPICQMKGIWGGTDPNIYNLQQIFNRMANGEIQPYPVYRNGSLGSFDENNGGHQMVLQ